MEPLMSTSERPESLEYSPRSSEERYAFNEKLNRNSRVTWKQAFFCLLPFTCLAIVAVLIGIYHRMTDTQKCSCQEMNDVGSNLLVNDDLSIINKVARPYHYLEPGYDVNDFVAADPLWAKLFPGKNPQNLLQELY